MDPYVIFKAEGQVRRPSYGKFVITLSTIGFISAGFVFIRGESVIKANVPPVRHTYFVAPRYIHHPIVGDLSPLSHIGHRKKKEVGLFGMRLCMVRESSCGIFRECVDLGKMSDVIPNQEEIHVPPRMPTDQRLVETIWNNKCFH